MIGQDFRISPEEKLKNIYLHVLDTLSTSTGSIILHVNPSPM